jgi:hypothetical protein
MDNYLNITTAQASAFSQFISAIAKEAYKEAYKDIEAVAEGKLSGYAYIEENEICQAVLSAIEAARVGQKPKSVILEYTPVK